MESRRRAEHLNDVVNALRRITQALRLSSTVVQDTLGITGAQLFVLQQLAECPGASLRELADRTLTDQSSVSVVVSRLVDAGHVGRRISQSDGRRTELTLTDTGRWMIERAPELAQSRLVAALRAMPSSQLRIAATVLDRAARAIHPMTGPAEMFFEPAAVKRRGGPRGRKPAAPGRGGAR
jgi:DNA-binding MarR family transcriptional regulator